MAIFFQNIVNGMRQQYARRSIGSGGQGVRRFSMKDIESYIEGLMPYELRSMRSKVDELAPTGFQIWGIPQAASVVPEIETGDFLLLLESTDFSYVGQVLHRTSQQCRELSRHMWGGKQEVPHIALLLQGELIAYLWDDFLNHFGFSPKFRRGTTRRLADERVAASSARTEEAFIATLLRTTGIKPGDLDEDFQAFENDLENHFRLVKARGLSH